MKKNEKRDHGNDHIKKVYRNVRKMTKTLENQRFSHTSKYTTLQGYFQYYYFAKLWFHEIIRMDTPTAVSTADPDFRPDPQWY